MAYHETVCRAGRTEMHAKYYSIRCNDGRERGPEVRAKKRMPTTEQQEKINRRKSEQMLTRILNANFGKRDWYITYSYDVKKRPANSEEFKRQVKQLLKKLRKIYKKAGTVFRYVWVAEVGARGATHIHMVQSGIDLDLLREAWPYGYLSIKPMDASGSYWRLANYFMKYSDKTMKTEGRLQGKRYNCSQNLKRPEPEKKYLRKRKRFDPENIHVPKGWYLEQETLVTGVDANGYEYLRYTLVMLPGYDGKKKGREKKCRIKG